MSIRAFIYISPMPEGDIILTTFLLYVERNLNLYELHILISGQNKFDFDETF